MRSEKDKHECSWLLRWKSSSYSDIEHTVIEEGIVEGNRGWALVKEINLRDSGRDWDWNTRYNFMIDYSECRLGHNRALQFSNTQKYIPSFFINYGPCSRTVTACLRNSSPSWWDNGFGICEYLCIELFRFKNAKLQLKDVIEGKDVVLSDEVEGLMKWSDLADQISGKMKPIVDFWETLRPLIPRGKDDFCYI